MSFTDPYVDSFRQGDETIPGVPLTKETLEAADLVVITCKHSDVDFSLVARHARAIVDTRNAMPRGSEEAKLAKRLVRL